MKKSILIFFAFCFSFASYAQTFSNITGTVTDSDGQAWKNAPWVATIVSPAGPAVYTTTGQRVPNVYGTLDANGTFVSAQLPNNALSNISPAGTCWKVTIWPNTSAGSQTLPCQTINAAFDMGSFASAHIHAPRINADVIVYAYNATEILNPVVGTGYVNTTNNSVYSYNGNSYVLVGASSGGVTSVVGPSGSSTGVLTFTGSGVSQSGNTFTFNAGGGSGSPSGASGTVQYNNAGAFGGSNCTVYSSTEIQTNCAVDYPYNDTFQTGAYSTVPHIHNYYHSTFMGAGVNLGNSGGWTVGHDYVSESVFGVRGISQSISLSNDFPKVGDNAGVYSDIKVSSGYVDQSGEGETAGTFKVTESYGYYGGTVTATTGTGDTAPVLSANGITTDGGFILNKRSALAKSGQLNGSSQSVPGSSYLYSLPVTGVTLPVSTARCIGTSALSSTNTTADVETPTTISCTLQTIGGVANPMTVGFADNAGSNYPERVYISAVSAPVAGVQTITINRRYPNSTIDIWQGGIAGSCLSFDNQTTVAETSYKVVGSLTGAEMVYAFDVGGSTNYVQLPVSTMTGVGTTGTTSAWHLYPCAEVVAAYNPKTSGVKLEPNDIPWQVGDPVDEPNNPSWTARALFVRNDHATIALPGEADDALNVTVNGNGISGASNAIDVVNSNYASGYISGGGTKSAPTAIREQGPFTTAMYLSPVGDCIICGAGWLNTTSGLPTTNRTIIGVDGGHLYLNPSTQSWTFDQNLSTSGSFTAFSGTFTNLTAGNFTLSNDLSVQNLNFSKNLTQTAFPGGLNTLYNLGVTYDFYNPRGISTGASGGNADAAGVLTVPPGSTTSGIRYFSATNSTPPVCIVQPRNMAIADQTALGGYTATVTTATLQITIGNTTSSGASFGYICTRID